MSAASVWITFSTIRVAEPERVGSDRPSAETTPAVTDPAKPFGFPIATTSWPTWSRVRVAELGGGRARSAPSAERRGRRAGRRRRPRRRARARRRTRRRRGRAPATTCAEVSTKPSGVITTPLPPPSRRPRATRRFATDGESLRATSVTTREYASSGASLQRDRASTLPWASSSSRAIGCARGRGRDQPRRRRPDDHAQPSGVVQRASRPRCTPRSHAALEEARGQDVRAVVITGAGKGFCAGQDLSEFRERRARHRRAPRGDLPPERARDPRAREARDRGGQRRRRRRRALARLRLRHPHRRRQRRVRPGFIGIGLVPDSGGSYFIARLLGPSRAFAWMTSNRRLTAAEAHAWGLVDEVVAGRRRSPRAPPSSPPTMRPRPTRGIGMTKRLFDHAQHATLDEQLALEARAADGGDEDGGLPRGRRPRSSRSARRTSPAR